MNMFDDDKLYVVEGLTLNTLRSNIQKYANITGYDKRDMENLVYLFVDKSLITEAEGE